MGFGGGCLLGVLTSFLRGAGEVLQGSLVRLVSLWWEFPPRLDSNNNIASGRMQQFFVFQNGESFIGPIEIFYRFDLQSDDGSVNTRDRALLSPPGYAEWTMP